MRLSTDDTIVLTRLVAWGVGPTEIAARMTDWGAPTTPATTPAQAAAIVRQLAAGETMMRAAIQAAGTMELWRARREARASRNRSATGR